MQEDFGCSVALATLTLQLNWITNALANSACGGLSDRLGRRATAVAFLGFYVIGAGICAAAPSVYWLAAGRVLQGLGQGASVLPSAVALDLVDDPAQRLQALAFLGSLRPLVVIAAGGGVQASVGEAPGARRGGARR